MARTEEEKRLQQGQPAAAAAAPSVYGGAYDKEIADLFGEYKARPAFSYNVDGDALFRMYKDRYTQNAKRSMKDTMGQAASLTGGYGSTYAQGVGQQAFDETMRGLTDKIPELEERAFSRYQREGEDILNRYNMAQQLGAADQATRQYQQEWDFQQQQYGDQRSDAEREWDFRQGQYADSKAQQAYGNLSSAILESGYTPTAEELAAAGMTAQQAAALRQAWIGANPGLAYMSGALSAEDYFKLTGEQAPGAIVAGSGGYSGSGKKKKTSTVTPVSPSTSAGSAGSLLGNALSFIGNRTASAVSNAVQEAAKKNKTAPTGGEVRRRETK